ncbi:protein-disulfide reductase DsbD domain-containing protein [Sphingomonas sp. BK235]|uniref:protein-disulfide reductase DsbD family protein n=1 Tax=Sphingomonas sp. BK235 TaxID=2512131 RepID=UPI001044CA33|nr:protein-disulfide reductase DsbD domain-containing protein [Sphingomonas sp. BK235]TCP33757.1 thiol:disulfide interchange protein [Sphingomonas sp. BK235]
MVRQAVRAALFILVTLLAGSGASAQPARHVALTLVAESDRPAAGGEVALAFRAVPQPGWHGYWRNPGDAGVPTRVTWTLPAGARAGELDYPVPSRLLIAGLMNYVYEKPWALLTTLRVPAGLAPGTRLPLVAKLDYLVCTAEICVPETQTLTLDLTVGDGAIDPARRSAFDGWRRALPRPLSTPATWQRAGDRFRLAVPFPADAPASGVWFYPAGGGAIDYAAPQTVTRDGDTLTVETKAAAEPLTGEIAGVLATGAGGGLALTARPGTVAPPRGGEGMLATALVAFAGAVLGGLLLNVMPCVFPILSLKALGLARSGESAAHARREALAYTAGVLLVCVGLGAGLLALRAAGSSAGWAFQLQDPRVIGALLLLVTAIALNLAGLFELPTPQFAARSGAAGAFATGALAAFVATPCTGPFMGAALGAALVLPAAAALAVFAGLGLGIALPFLLIGFVPALRARLPRPGAWMTRLRRILSLPMWLTALALAWVLGRQAGVDGMTLGLAATLLAAVGLWWTGLRQHAGRDAAWWPAGVALLLALGGVALVRPAASGASAVAGLPGAEPFSEARLAALRAEGRPVFAYFTADWCLTCKVNEKAAIETATTAAAFKEGKVAVLVGDWTDGDPVLGRFIEAHNRAGVPLYLWYKPGAATPRVLPQVLTSGMLAALPADR